jgi:hypothetical protein
VKSLRFVRPGASLNQAEMQLGETGPGLGGRSSPSLDGFLKRVGKANCHEIFPDRVRLDANLDHRLKLRVSHRRTNLKGSASATRRAFLRLREEPDERIGLTIEATHRAAVVEKKLGRKIAAVRGHLARIEPLYSKGLAGGR